MQPRRLTRRAFNSGVVAGAASLASASARSSAGPNDRPQTLAGAAETVVTPPAKGTVLIGPMAESTGVHDDLYARALVLSDGTRQVAIVSIDYLGFDLQYNDVIVAAISAATGIPAKRIMVNASHNHSAPMTIPWGPWEKNKDKPWHKTLPVQLAELVKKARDGIRPVTLRYNREPTQIAFNRRVQTDDGNVVMAPNPQGKTIPWVDVLAADGVDGERVGVLFSYAAHPVIVHGASTLISADFPGFAVQKLRETSHGNGVFMFAQGCGGDINGFPLRGGIKAAEAAGRDLSLAVTRAVGEKGNLLEHSALKDVSSELQLPLQAPPPVKKCREMVEKNPQNDRLAELLAIAERGEPQTIRFPIRAIALGDALCILALPHEMFAEYQLYVEKVSPFQHNMVFGYTNGCECYVATQKDYEMGDRGGYEAAPMGAAMLYHRRLALEPRAEGIIKAGIDRALRALKTA